MIELSTLSPGNVYVFSIAEEKMPDGDVLLAETKTRRYLGTRVIDSKVFLRVEHVGGRSHLIWHPSVETAVLAVPPDERSVHA
jgi:hypothetical protein